MTPEPDFDTLAERIRQRITEPRDDYERGYCDSCEVLLTQSDIDREACSNCGATLSSYENSDDEDLFD